MSEKTNFLRGNQPYSPGAHLPAPDPTAKLEPLERVTISCLVRRGDYALLQALQYLRKLGVEVESVQIVCERDD